MVRIRTLWLCVVLGLAACHPATPVQDATSAPLRTPTSQPPAIPFAVATALPTASPTAAPPTATPVTPTATAPPTPTMTCTVPPTPTRRPTATPTATPLPPIERIGGTLVLVAVRASNVVSPTSSTPEVSNLVLVDVRSGALTRLTEGDHRDVNPSWSPDGQRIAFSSNRTGQFEIYTIHRDGTGLVQVTREDGDKRYPSWSPDGGRLAFLSKTEQGDFVALQIIDLETREVTTVIQKTWSSEGPFYYSLDWSPVDENLLLLSGMDSWTWQAPEDSEPGSRLGSRVCLLDLRSGQETILTPGGWMCYIPVWSPDGTMVVQNFCCRVDAIDGTCSPIVGTLTATETGLALEELRWLGGITAGWVYWSPDGEFWAVTGSSRRMEFVEIHEVRPYMTYRVHFLRDIYGTAIYFMPVHRVESEAWSLSEPDWAP